MLHFVLEQTQSFIIEIFSSKLVRRTLPKYQLNSPARKSLLEKVGYGHRKWKSVSRYAFQSASLLVHELDENTD